MFFKKTLSTDTTERDRHLHYETKQLLMTLGDSLATHTDLSSIQINCHSACRAFALAIPDLKCVDGYFLGLQHTVQDGKINRQLRHCTHSWLETPDFSIIELYPVAMYTSLPLLVVCRGIDAPFGGDLYLKAPKVEAEIATEAVKQASDCLFRLIQKSGYVYSPR